MKRTILPFLLLLSSASLFSQSEKYVAAMKSNIGAIDSSWANPPAFLTLSNTFERIGKSEKNQWLPFYYAAYCEVNYGFMETDKSKTDALADRATALLNIADSLSPNNSEISCIRSMIASCHLMVNPMQRYMEYGAASSENIDKAMAQDPTNPRPYLLKGQNLKYTPEQFGGGCGTAKPELENALAKYGTFQPASDLAPVWGKQRVEQLLKECK